MAIFRFARSVYRIWKAIRASEDPKVVVDAVAIHESTGFDIVTAYEIAKNARASGVDAIEVANTAQHFHIRWRDALKETIEQHARPPN